ncbi:ABC transporter substrate-binding protein [Kordia jejudonensis]|uniref:ABC transporter substrate-binding protein n=1 Tax=Kordia jejudonensis TaxID=1348245 RepID=UPI0006297A33|nr:ABC transporter substrate-binding protein [Kordia jejudonensis]
MIRIGISADLSPNGSIHQDTFINAVKMAAKNLELEKRGIELIWENDFATAEGGTIAAQHIVAKQVHAVIGHYASAAAKNALKTYKNAFPVFLPAATADALTRDFPNAFRLCGKDSDLAAFIKNEFQKIKTHTLYIDHDNSTHGIALSTLIKKQLRTLTHVSLVQSIATANKVMYVGNYNHSIKFIEKNLTDLKTIDEIFFTDDLVRPELPKKLGHIDQKVVVFGYEHASQCKTATRVNNQYYKQFSDYPMTYFLETYAAIEIVVQLYTTNTLSDWQQQLHKQTWKTCIGDLTFDTYGDSNFKRFAKWSIENTQLVVVENYN